MRSIHAGDNALTRQVMYDMTNSSQTGPLVGLRVLELAGLGPAPHAAMVLADLGADVVRIVRPGEPGLALGRPGAIDPGLRGRASTTVDIKDADGRACVLALVRHADVLLEGSAPGSWSAWGSGQTVASPRIPASSTVGSPAGARTGRWPSGSGTTSTTSA